MNKSWKLLAKVLYSFKKRHRGQYRLDRHLWIDPDEVSMPIEIAPSSKSRIIVGVIHEHLIHHLWDHDAKVV